MSGKGVPPPASLHNIINDLFQNEKYIYLNTLQNFVLF